MPQAPVDPTAPPRPLVAAIVGSPAQARELVALLRGRPEERLLRLVRAASLAEAGSLAAAHRVDCLLVGAHAVASAAAVAPDIALVGVSPDDDDAPALAALRAGAQDCLPAGPLEARDVVRTIRLAVERQRLGADLRHRALHDPLTALPNRTLLHDRLEHALAEAARDGGGVAVVFADLDGFKAINDQAGHHAGDLVLVETAQRLLAGVRPGDTVARYGGDEFAIVCKDAGPVQLAAVVRRLDRALRRPVPTGGEPVRIGASFGTAFATGPDEPPGLLLRRADAAMYAAKRRRRQAACVR